VIGSGSLNDAARTSFDFAVLTTSSGLDGRLLDHEGVDLFAAVSIRTLTIDDRTATFAGTGTWDGLAGYTFTVRVVDAGARGSETPGRSAARMTDDGRRSSARSDRFAITIRGPLGVLVFSTDAALTRGEIVINGNTGHDEDGADAPRLRAIVGGRAIAE